MRGLAALVLVVLSWCGPAHAAGLWTTSKAERIEQIIAGYRAAHASEDGDLALSVGVGVNGELVVAKGWGEIGAGVAAGPETLYHIGSLTKQFTAAGVLSLIEQEGRERVASPLTLDRPLRDLFDGVAGWETAGAGPMTVRSLLTMTSHLPNFTKEPPPETDPWGAIPAERLLAEVKKLTPLARPNGFSYSNTSYFLLSEIIEMRAKPEPGGQGSSYRDYLRAELFAPLGMTHTGFVDEASPGSLAPPHFRRDVGFGKPDWFKGSGDVVSNVADLFKWDKALMEGRAVSTATRTLMTTPAAPITPALAYGMGFYVERVPGLTIYSHSGTVPGYTAFNAIVVEQGKPGWISVTVLTNGDAVDDLPRLADALVVVALED